MNVLIVEDRVGLPLVKMLEKWGYKTQLAEDGETAWDILKTTEVDLLISDWNLPGLSGLDLVKRVRKLDKFQELPILMISGRSHKTDIVTAVQSGIDNYIIKPFTAVQFKEKIQQVLEGREKDDGFKKNIELLVAGHEAFSRREENPFVVFGEVANRTMELSELARRSSAQCLIEASNAIAELNSQHQQLGLGYTILLNTNDIIKYVKAGSIRKRIGMIAVSIDCSGNVPLLARLLGANPEYEFPVIVLCDQASTIKHEQLAMLESYGVKVYERRELNAARWKSMLEKFAAQYGKDEPSRGGDISLFGSE